MKHPFDFANAKEDAALDALIVLAMRNADDSLLDEIRDVMAELEAEQKREARER